jgi:hypothetical protein
MVVLEGSTLCDHIASLWNAEVSKIKDQSQADKA